jgi:hypothetical protein
VDEFTTEQIVMELRRRMGHVCVVGVPHADVLEPDEATQLMVSFGGDLFYVLGLIEHAKDNIHKQINDSMTSRTFHIDGDDEDFGEDDDDDYEPFSEN